MKNQNYNVYTISQKDKKEYILKHFEKDFEAREFVRKQLEKDLKFFYYQTSDEFSMLEKYFECRKYSYKILNDDFDCDAYIKHIASRVFDFLQQNSINKGFKILENKNERNLLKDIENCKIIQISNTEKFIEIIYEKDEKIKYLTIEQMYVMGSMVGFMTFFKFDDEKLEDEKKVVFLKEIKSIVKIFHLVQSEQYYRNDLIEIIYKNEENITCSYHLTFEEDLDDIVVNPKKYENIFYFKSEILNNKRKTQLVYNYDDEYFCPKYFADEVDENNNIKRACYGYYDLDYPLCLFGKKLRFEFDENLGIKAYNLSSFEYELLPDIEVYNSLSKEEKEKLHHFLRIAELYINSLEINQEFNNEITFDWEKEPENYDNLEKINEFLNNNFEKKLLYNNAEQGHPSTKDVYIYTKDDKKLFYFSEIKYYGDYEIVTLKYNDDLKWNIYYYKDEENKVIDV